jgi:hypothetical protein
MLLDFEIEIANKSGQDGNAFKRRRDYILLHARMIYRWNLLNEIGDYRGMIKYKYSG